jgi:hypothetical protein
MAPWLYITPLLGYGISTIFIDFFGERAPVLYLTTSLARGFVKIQGTLIIVKKTSLFCFIFKIGNEGRY